MYFKYSSTWYFFEKCTLSTQALDTFSENVLQVLKHLILFWKMYSKYSSTWYFFGNCTPSTQALDTFLRIVLQVLKHSILFSKLYSKYSSTRVWYSLGPCKRVRVPPETEMKKLKIKKIDAWEHNESIKKKDVEKNDWDWEKKICEMKKKMRA